MSTRRSLRARTTAAVDGTAAPDSTIGESEEEWASHPPPPAKKRRTVNANAGKRSRGKGGVTGFGAKIPDFPLDVLYEILLYLCPEDLMQLTRTSKAMRNALTSKAAQFAWKQVLATSGLPACPSDLNEMEYTRFVCDTYCNWCDSSRKSTKHYRVYPTWRQVCGPCVQREFRDIKYEQSAVAIMPYASVSVGQRKRWGEARPHVPYTDYTAIISERNSIEPVKERQEWILKKSEKNIQAQKVRSGIEAWLKKKADDKALREELARYNRYNTVVQKLKDEGWAEDVAWMEEMWPEGETPLHQTKGVFLSQALTDQAWTKLKPEAIGCMELRRRQRIIATRNVHLRTRLPLLREAIDTYKSMHPYDMYGPNYADVAVHPEVSSLMFGSTDPTKEDFDHVLQDSYDLISTNWREMIKLKLLDHISAHIPSATADILEDPATIFHCAKCKGWLHFPHVLSHRCNHTVYEFSKSEFDDKTLTSGITCQSDEHHYMDKLRCIPWSDKTLTFHYGLYKKAKMLLEILGEEVSSITARLSDFLECLSCSKKRKRRVIMTWNEGMAGPESCVAKDHELQKIALSKEEKQVKDLYVDFKISISQRPPLACAICHVSHAYPDSEGLASHQSKKHGRKSKAWLEGVDFYRLADVANTKFKEEFILEEKPNIRDVIFMMTTQDIPGGCSSRSALSSSTLDLRTDPEFAEVNYQLRE